MAGVYDKGTPLRRIRERQGAQMRQRGGSVIRGEVTQVDHVGTDPLTDTTVPGGISLGSYSAASSARGTSLKLTGVITSGAATVGIATETITDDLFGRVAYSTLGEGEDVLVEAVIEVHADATAGVLLVASAVAGVGCFRAVTVEESAVAFARLESDATTANDMETAFDSTVFVRRWVTLFSHGVPTGLVSLAGAIDTADIAPDAITGALIADDAVGPEHIEDEAIKRAHIADAAGMPGITRAALFEPGIAGSMQRCSFTFDPTNTTDLACGGYRRGLSRPAASSEYDWCGLVSADRLNVSYKNTAGVYTVELRESNTVLATYTWTDDLEEHSWAFATSASASTISLDGVAVATGTAPTFLDTSATFCFGNAGISTSHIQPDHATWRDAYVTDPATATNKVRLRLDEPAGGPYYNAYLRLGDPLYDATNTSAVTIATTGTDTARPKSVEVNTVDGGAAPVIAGGRTTHMRVAAFSGLGDHATAGQFGLVSWAPTGTPAFNVEFDCRRSLTQGGSIVVWGSSVALYADVFVTAAGIVDARIGGASICSTTVAALPPDGRTRRVRVEFRDSGADVTAAIYINRQLVASGTRTAVQFSAVAANHYIGGFTGARRYSGSIFNLLLEDLNSAANSGFWLMDEPRGSTTYANTYPGTSLAGLTINGFVSSCGVESEDGKGRPWQPGDGGAFRYGARLLADAAGITGVTSQTITGLTEDERDPTGHYAAGVFTAPCAGVAVFNCNASIAATTLAGADDITLGVTATSGDVYSSKATLTAANVYVPTTASGIAVLAAGDTLTAAFASLLAGDVYTIAAGAAFKIDFTPTPVAG